MSNYNLIAESALRLGKTKQDIANWNFSGKVPRAMRFDLYKEVKKLGVDLDDNDFENFKK